MRGQWKRSRILMDDGMPGIVLTPQERQEIRQEKAEIQAAINLVPPEWLEVTRTGGEQPRLIHDRLEEAKGEEETDFNDMGDMFIVEPGGSLWNSPPIGLAYITHYVGFGAIHFVWLANFWWAQMSASKGMFIPDAQGSEIFRFYRIRDRNLHANVPHAAAPVPAQQVAAAAAAYPAAVGANPPAALAVNPIGAVNEDPSNSPNNVRSPIENNPNALSGGRKRHRSRKGKKATHRHKKYVRKQKKHTRKH
jgi:hypothetical protein